MDVGEEAEIMNIEENANEDHGVLSLFLS